MTSREADEGRWTDVRSAVALTGVSRLQLVWAMTLGDVRFTTRLPGHERVPMVFLHDVARLAAGDGPGTRSRTPGG
jgi:hypothetical protein